MARKTITVHFENVGPKKMSWSTRMRAVTSANLARAINRKRAFPRSIETIDFVYFASGQKYHALEIHTGAGPQGTIRVEAR
jgi:hypothetical protein